jgi:hypothetical protein
LIGEANALWCTQRIARRASTDLRIGPPGDATPSSSLHSSPDGVNQDLRFPIPAKRVRPVAQLLPRWRRRASHRLEGPNRLRSLAPQSRFVPAHAVGRVLALGDDAFEPEVAAVAEDGRTAAFLVELGGWDQPWPGQL